MRTLLTMMAAAALLVGCRTTDGGYDPVRTEQVKAALQPAVSTAITAILTKDKPEKAQEIAAYFRAIGGIFCEMARTKTFSPSFLVAEINKIFDEHVKGEIIVIAVKNSLVSLYTIFYEARHRAELSEQEWPFHVSDLFCKSIGQGLVDAGLPGITPASP